jgi:hypothetical protein
VSRCPQVAAIALAAVMILPCAARADPGAAAVSPAAAGADPAPPAAAPSADPGCAGARVAAAPVARCSGNAGDEQYVDPFRNATPPPRSGGSHGSHATHGAPGTTPRSGRAAGGVGGGGAVAAQSSAGGAAGGDGTASATARTGAAGELPVTGLPAASPALLGLALLLAGVALRRRAA